MEYNSSDDMEDMEDIENDDCTQLHDRKTIKTSNSPTDFPITENSGKHLNSEEDNGNPHHIARKLPRKFCEICFTTMTQQEFGLHLCLNRVIVCEYCTIGIFTTTVALRKHLSDAHADLQFYKCDKCTLAFPMRTLLEIHERTDQTHFNVACGELVEVSSDSDELSMDNSEY